MTLGKMNLSDIPVELATPLNGVGILGTLETKVKEGSEYTQIYLPIYYQPSNDEKNGVDTSVDGPTLAQLAETVVDNDTAKAAGMKRFDARWVIKENWFDASFLQALRNNEVDANEKMSYQINVAGVTRQLFQALGSKEVDFDSVPSGKLIGFKASAGKKDPEKLQIRLFFSGPKL